MSRFPRSLLPHLRALARHDFFPDFSARFRRWFYNPLGVLLLAALAALFCGFFLHSQGFILCAGVLVVVLLGVCWPSLTLRGLAGSLAFDRGRATEGDTIGVTLTLRNRLLWAAFGLVVQHGFRDVPIVTIASAPRRRTARCRWLVTLPRRGVYPRTGPRLASAFPFGLWENHRCITTEGTLLVWPRTYPVGPVPMISGDQQIEGIVSHTKVGTSGDVLGVRPYRRGDSPRRIHWAQSARHDRVIVCELQSHARPMVQLVFDGGDCGEETREWAIRIVASFAKGWLAEGVEVGAVWNGEMFPPASGQQQTQRLLDSLARLPDQLKAQVCPEFRDGLQVIVTTNRVTITKQNQRWVVVALEQASESPNAWLSIDSIERIPALLRCGWKEAQHGS